LLWINLLCYKFFSHLSKWENEGCFFFHEMVSLFLINVIIYLLVLNPSIIPKSSQFCFDCHIFKIPYILKFIHFLSLENSRRLGFFQYHKFGITHKWSISFWKCILKIIIIIRVYLWINLPWHFDLIISIYYFVCLVDDPTCDRLFEFNVGG